MKYVTMAFVTGLLCGPAVLAESMAACAAGNGPSGTNEALPLNCTGSTLGTLVAHTVSHFSYNTTSGSTSGLVNCVVYNDGGMMDFYYQVVNDASSGTSIALVEADSFLGFTTNTAYITNGSEIGTGFVDGGIAPQLANISGGGTINFAFYAPLATGVISPGRASDVFIISTNASKRALGSVAVKDGGSSGPLPAFQPSSGGFESLYSFGSGMDGALPQAPLAEGPGHALYGTTNIGGVSNKGTVFSFTPPNAPGGAWMEKVIYAFSGSDGANPTSGLVTGHGGVLFGTTAAGGAFHYGTIFSLTPPATAGGNWTEQVLYSFGTTGGRGPGAITMGQNDILYGTTEVGGGALGGSKDYGTVWALAPPLTPGGAWRFDQIYAFTGGADGCHPTGVTIGSDGTLYGGTTQCGASGNGTIFSLTPSATQGQPWSFSLLYSVEGPADCSGPTQPVLGADGVLYAGVSTRCDESGAGVFSLTPPATPGGAWTENTLYSFPAGNVLTTPITLGQSGVIYGAYTVGGTDGNVYLMRPPVTPGGEWSYEGIHTLDGADGVYPNELSLIHGSLFGTTDGGGTFSDGTIFRVGS